MSPEEFNRIKEAEKEHLRKLKALKQAAGRLERQRSIAQALGNMTQEAEQKLEANRSTVEKLAWETAQQEARLELALEAAQEDPHAGAETAADAQHEMEQADEALRQARAQEIVRQIKHGAGLGESSPDVQPSDVQTSQAADPDVQPPEHRSGSFPSALPEKTLGRMP